MALENTKGLTIAGGSPDWIDLFLEFTHGIPSPDIFRLWSAISCIAGALERRVWAEVARGRIYPNLYTLLVGPPGVGKSQAIARCGDLWRTVRDFHVAPDNMTKASLVDAVGRASRNVMFQGQMHEYHSMLIPSTEFGVLVPAHDLDFLNVLNKLFDNEPYYREERRHLGNKQIDISNPQLNIIGGTQPSYLATLLPEQAWGMGFMTRMIMVYANQQKKIKLFAFQHEDQEIKKALASRLQKISKLFGPMQWNLDAAAEAERWHDTGMEPLPTHSKLEAYNARRMLHVIKLTIVASMASRGDMQITLGDFNRARDWLLQAEQLMPDIFREMVSKSDSQVLSELHYYMWKIWVAEKRPVHQSRIWHFLQVRVPVEKIPRLIEVAERANMIKADEMTPQSYVPRPQHEFGVE